MNKSKSAKGITLVALIITIIVLLILAVVAIGAVNSTGIINYAENSVDMYKAGRDNETAILQSYVDYIKENEPKDEQGIITQYYVNEGSSQIDVYALTIDGENVNISAYVIDNRNP